MVELYLTNLLKKETEVKAGTGEEIRIKVTGHAGFDKKNRDIVCAGISAIIQTAIIAISKVANIRQKIKQKHGCLESKIKIDELNNTQLRDLLIIINTMLAGLEEIMKIYPEALIINYEKDLRGR